MMDYFDWVDKYEPISDEPQDWEDIKGTETKYVWTQVDSDEGAIIVSGMHIVNRLGYFVTRVSHEFEHIEVD